MDGKILYIFVLNWEKKIRIIRKMFKIWMLLLQTAPCLLSGWTETLSLNTLWTTSSSEQKLNLRLSVVSEYEETSSFAKNRWKTLQKYLLIRAQMHLWSSRARTRKGDEVHWGRWNPGGGKYKFESPLTQKGAEHGSLCKFPKLGWHFKAEVQKTF